MNMSWFMETHGFTDRELKALGRRMAVTRADRTEMFTAVVMLLAILAFGAFAVAATS